MTGLTHVDGEGASARSPDRGSPLCSTPTKAAAWNDALAPKGLCVSLLAAVDAHTPRAHPLSGLPSHAAKDLSAGYDLTPNARSLTALPIFLELIDLRRSRAGWVSRLDPIERLGSFAQGIH